MDKEAMELIVMTYFLVALAITSFIATLPDISDIIRIVAIIMTLIFAAAMGVAHYMLKKRG